LPRRGGLSAAINLYLDSSGSHTAFISASHCFALMPRSD
jgi:hypothetical protein